MSCDGLWVCAGERDVDDEESVANFLKSLTDESAPNAVQLADASRKFAAQQFNTFKCLLEDDAFNTLQKRLAAVHQDPDVKFRLSAVIDQLSTDIEAIDLDAENPEHERQVTAAQCALRQWKLISKGFEVCFADAVTAHLNERMPQQQLEQHASSTAWLGIAPCSNRAAW